MRSGLWAGLPPSLTHGGHRSLGRCWARRSMIRVCRGCTDPPERRYRSSTKSQSDFVLPRPGHPARTRFALKSYRVHRVTPSSANGSFARPERRSFLSRANLTSISASTQGQPYLRHGAAAGPQHRIIRPDPMSLARSCRLPRKSRRLAYAPAAAEPPRHQPANLLLTTDGVFKILDSASPALSPPAYRHNMMLARSIHGARSGSRRAGRPPSRLFSFGVCSTISLNRPQAFQETRSRPRSSRSCRRSVAALIDSTCRTKSCRWSSERSPRTGIPISDLADCPKALALQRHTWRWRMCRRDGPPRPYDATRRRLLACPAALNRSNRQLLVRRILRITIHPSDHYFVRQRRRRSWQGIATPSPRFLVAVRSAWSRCWKRLLLTPMKGPARSPLTPPPPPPDPSPPPAHGVRARIAPPTPRRRLLLRTCQRPTSPTVDSESATTRVSGICAPRASAKTWPGPVPNARLVRCGSRR